MSVTATTNVVSEAGNGVKVAFDFAFKIFAQTELLVYKATAAGVYTLQALTTDYTVSFNTAAETGTVTFLVAPVNAGKSVIMRATASTQGSSLPREGNMPEKTIENALDKLTLQSQDQNEKLSRAPLQPSTPASPAAIVIEAPVNAKGLRWRLTGGIWYIESTSEDPDSSVAAAAASATSAAASAAIAVAAAAGLGELSGLRADRPAAPLAAVFYWSTDALTYERYSLIAARWFLVG